MNNNYEIFEVDKYGIYHSVTRQFAYKNNLHCLKLGRTFYIIDISKEDIQSLVEKVNRSLNKNFYLRIHDLNVDEYDF